MNNFEFVEHNPKGVISYFDINVDFGGRIITVELQRSSHSESIDSHIRVFIYNIDDYKWLKKKTNIKLSIENLDFLEPEIEIIDEDFLEAIDDYDLQSQDPLQ